MGSSLSNELQTVRKHIKWALALCISAPKDTETCKHVPLLFSDFVVTFFWASTPYHIRFLFISSRTADFAVRSCVCVVGNTLLQILYSSTRTPRSREEFSASESLWKEICNPGQLRRVERRTNACVDPTG